MAKPSPEFHEELRRWRARLELTQVAAAEALNVPPRTFEGWETGKPPRHLGPLRIAMSCVEKHAR